MNYVSVTVPSISNVWVSLNSHNNSIIGIILTLIPSDKETEAQRG